MKLQPGTERKAKSNFGVLFRLLGAAFCSELDFNAVDTLAGKLTKGVWQFVGKEMYRNVT